MNENIKGSVWNYIDYIISDFIFKFKTAAHVFQTGKGAQQTVALAIF